VVLGKRRGGNQQEDRVMAAKAHALSRRTIGGGRVARRFCEKSCLGSVREDMCRNKKGICTDKR